MSTLKPDNDADLNKAIRKAETKSMVQVIKSDAELQDYITHHNRVDGKTDCIKGQHHFIAVGDPDTKKDIIQCSECDIKLEEHIEAMRQRRDLRREQKRTQEAQQRLDELSKTGLEKQHLEEIDKNIDDDKPQ